MLITLSGAAIGSGLAAAVPPLTLAAGPGVSVVAVETAERPMLVSMLLGGRLRAEYGGVLVDGVDDPDELRRRAALVDTPVVAEPTAGLGLSTVVAEELSFAGLPAPRGEVRAFLERHELFGYAKVAVRSLPPADRVRLFCELALLRPGIEALIVTSPERHGGEPAAWFAALDAIGARGVTVVIVTDAVTAHTLTTLGATDATLIPTREAP